ncbi:hypothetical protein DTL42_21710 [Bremerella cremea]|uniref:Uncharacterized protein n=1 Tax=Bremerella cremea TaxID=1031537 RepID=A0A368KNT6_9BACT|nr:hypothetical protein [Bremerella cremea]RCS41190.1 hypothetical protein DTL42_21710 [Bremerella cremea]
MSVSPRDPLAIEADDPFDVPRKAEFDPVVFHLSDLIGLVAWFAILFALIRPFGPMIPLQFQFMMMAGIAIQMTVFLISVASQSRARHHAMNLGKNWLGISVGGRVWWFWPRIVVGFVAISIIIIFQFFISISLAFFWTPGWLLSVFSLWLPWESGKNFAKLRFGHMNKAIEFFENGIIVDSTQFVPWEQVRLKWWPSVAEQLTVITYLPKGSPIATVYEVGISSQLRGLLQQQGVLMDENLRGEAYVKPELWESE